MATAKKAKQPDQAIGKITDELQAQLVRAQTDLVETQRSHASRELVNTNRLRELRQYVARIKTALAQQAKQEIHLPKISEREQR